MNLIKEKNYFLILLILTLIVILPKWIIGANFFELDIVVNLLVNFVDIQYLPKILSFSEFNFSPTYLDNMKVEGVIGFPILPLLVVIITTPLAPLFPYIAVAEASFNTSIDSIELGS